jgi:hypothetical protein
MHRWHRLAVAHTGEVLEFLELGINAVWYLQIVSQCASLELLYLLHHCSGQNR